MSVNTKQVTGRRELHFHSLDDVLVELDRLEGRPLKTLGNWSVGQILMHLASSMNAALDGVQIKVPWYLRLLGPFFKGPLLKGKMPPGFKLPKEAAAVLLPSPASAKEGFHALRKAIARFKEETPGVRHPFLGKLSPDEWTKIMCRHCELHLSFIQL